MENKTLGEKIEYYRKRAKMSQLELELEIGASQGSISRIENGQVNPTKETIVSIIKTLNLNAFESANLFNIDTEGFAKMVKVSKDLFSTFDIDEVLQRAVDNIVYELNLLGSVIVLVEGERIRARTFTRQWYTQLVLNLFNVPFNNLSTKLTPGSENYFAKTILEDKNYFSTKLRDFTKDVIPDTLADLAQKVSTHACAISIPIKVRGKIIGGVLFTKDYIDDFSTEMNILEAFSEYIGIAIDNAISYEKLTSEIDKIKNGK